MESLNTYLVGGAVRDQLLDYPVHERDWVVVGATPEAMIERGFKPVGKDFPVFLHPDSGEEYALARTERKTGPGYTGFQFHASPDVTLEQDLQRRDLTINAMAMDGNGNLIDPCGGRADLQQRLLHHVSPHFVEDPVRVLRVARFAARYHHLGFRVAGETLSLMKTMVNEGEVDHLVPERVWKELERALGEKSPVVFFTLLRECGALARLLPELDKLFGVPQPAQHHPEIDCGIHSLMSLEQACRLSDDTCVRFASLVHDLGKATTPADTLPRHTGHEQRSLPLVDQLCQRLKVPNPFRELARLTAQYHTHCHRVQQLTGKTLLKTLEGLDAFRRPQRFEQFLLCCEADSRGRTGLEDRDYPQPTYFQGALQAALSVKPSAIDASRFSGKAFGDELRRQRISALNRYRKNNP